MYCIVIPLTAMSILLTTISHFFLLMTFPNVWIISAVIAYSNYPWYICSQFIPMQNDTRRPIKHAFH